MNITKEMVKTIQTLLNKYYDANLKIDGISGKNTINAIWRVTTIPTDWPQKRQLIGIIQHGATLEGIDVGPIDGYWGDRTSYGYDQLIVKLKTGNLPDPWRDDELNHITDQTPLIPNKWPIETTSDLVKFYGNVGTNQTQIISPYPLKLAWNLKQRVTKITVHEKIADSVLLILTRVRDHYGDKISKLGLDIYGGSLNVRKIRGGSRYSTHSWGIALDWDPQNNQLRWDHTKALFAKPEYNLWWKLWEEQGAVSLGRERDYDWQHVQFCRRK